MSTDAARRHRRSIRLRGYDYAQAGAYFVTICTQNRESLFGEIVDGEMRLNEAGMMIARWWTELTHKFPAVGVNASVIMPNHFHGIVVITEPVGHPPRGAPTPDGRIARASGDAVGATLCGRPPTLGDIMDWFKTMTTNAYIRGVKQQGWPPFPGKLWQRNYYERVVRNEEELNRIRQYIADNALRWAFDRENPDRQHGKDQEPWYV